MFNPLSWLQGKRIDTYSRELDQEFVKRYPLEMAQSSPNKKTEKKLGRALNHVYKHAREFRLARCLGVYGTARLRNGFKWEFREIGYRNELIEEAT